MWQLVSKVQWCSVWVVTLRVCASASASADNKRPRQRSQRQKAGCVRENAGAGRLVARVGWVRSRANPQPTAGIKIEAPSGPANQAAGRDQGQDVSKRGLQGSNIKDAFLTTRRGSRVICSVRERVGASQGPVIGREPGIFKQ